jgi:hypothetical protein
MHKQNSFKTAILATEKAINLKTNKLKQLDDDEKLRFNYEELSKLINESNYQLGYHTEKQKYGTSSQKNNSKKICVSLKKELTRLNKINNMCSIKHIDKEFLLKDEINALNQELRVLKNLSLSSNHKYSI